MVIVGRTKIPYNDLFVLSSGELNALIEGHEIDKRDDWERSAQAGMIALLPHLKKGAKITRQSILPFPWDKKENSTNFIERAAEKLKKFKERWQN